MCIRDSSKAMRGRWAPYLRSGEARSTLPVYFTLPRHLGRTSDYADLDCKWLIAELCGLFSSVCSEHAATRCSHSLAESETVCRVVRPTTFKLVDWTIVYDVWHGLSVSTDAQWVDHFCSKVTEILFCITDCTKIIHWIQMSFKLSSEKPKIGRNVIIQIF